MLQELINDYNSLSVKKELKGLLKYNDGKLLLANAEQLKYNTYQCILAVGDKEKITNIVKSLLSVLEYDFGE
jgi:hypothetical protein